MFMTNIFKMFGKKTIFVWVGEGLNIKNTRKSPFVWYAMVQYSVVWYDLYESFHH